MSRLFEPLSLGDLRMANRIVIAPMCQYSARDGDATDWHLIHLGHLALSGAGLLIIEATAVSPEGRISPDDLGLWSEANQASLARVLASVRKYSPMPIAIQLAHAGRKASCRAPWEGGAQIPASAGGWTCVAPSALPFRLEDETPAALDHDGLARVRDAFAAAARRAAAIGIDAIEIHAAHGYLLHQFLSPLANARDDDYGGWLEGRMRFPLEVFEAVRAAFPPGKPVGVRVSGTDWADDGWTIEDTVAFADALAARGCGWVHVSSGGLTPVQRIPVGPGYQVPLAARVKAATRLPTMAVGLITEPEQAEEILASGSADLVSLARAMLYDPRWPWHAAAKLGAQVDAPKQYWRSQPRDVKKLFRA